VRELEKLREEVEGEVKLREEVRGKREEVRAKRG
jgi:hypothetical protein